MKTTNIILLCCLVALVGILTLGTVACTSHRAVRGPQEQEQQVAEERARLKATVAEFRHLFFWREAIIAISDGHDGLFQAITADYDRGRPFPNTPAGRELQEQYDTLTTDQERIALLQSHIEDLREVFGD